MPLKLQSLSHALGEVTSPCRNQCFMDDKMSKVRSLSHCLPSTLILRLYRTRLTLLGMKWILMRSELSPKCHLTRYLVILQRSVLNLVMRSVYPFEDRTKA